MDSLFRKTLLDMVRGLRANKGEEGAFINDRISEIKEELKNAQPDVKSNGIEKLIYLQMLGYSMDFAAFNVIEVMNTPAFSMKRIGYLGCSQSFREDTSVMLLTTNLFKKDMTGQGGGALATSATLSQYESGLALSCLSNICTKELAQDLAGDVVSLLTSSKPYVRKKAVLCLYKIFLRFPKALRPSFPRLKEKLEDPDMMVVSSSVNVICELARKNPKNYLGLAPLFFRLLTASSNNWMLIKIVKLFGALTPLERRLGKKLVEPLSNIINNTSATSLLYECINTCVIGLSDHTEIIRLCISKLRALVEDPDQNLKYLGLLALNKIMAHHPKAITEHRELVIKCLDGEDVSIRSRALDLLTGMVTKRNLIAVIGQLMTRLESAEADYADQLVEKIVAMCCQDNYSLITDFEWYLSILVELTHIKGTAHGKLISNQLLDVTVRVKAIRNIAVGHMVSLLGDKRILGDTSIGSTIQEVLYAAAFITGEYAELVEDPYTVLEALLAEGGAFLVPTIQAVFMQNALKIIAFVAGQVDPEGGEDDEFNDEYLLDMLDLAKEALPKFICSVHIEVQERACLLLEAVNELEVSLEEKNSGLGLSLSGLFDTILNPVAARAQRKVPVPEGLDLDEEINPRAEEDDEEFTSEFWRQQASIFNGVDDLAQLAPADSPAGGGSYGSGMAEALSGKGPTAAVSAARKSYSPFILSGTNEAKDFEGDYVDPDHKVEELPSEMVNEIGGWGSGRKGKYGKGGKRRPRRKDIVVTVIEEEPEDLIGEDEDLGRKGKKKGKRDRQADVVLGGDDEDDLAAVDLTLELRPDEVLPVRSHRVVADAPSAPAKEGEAEEVPEEEDGKRRRKGRGRGRKGDRKGRGRKRRESQKGGGEEGKTQAAQLLDNVFGDDVNAPAIVEEVPEPVVEQVVEPVKQASPPPSPRTLRRRKREERKGKGGSERSSRGSRGSSRASREKEQPQQQQQQQQQQPQQQQQKQPKEAGKDENIQVIYELQPFPNHPQGAMVLVGLRNVGSRDISGFQFKYGSSANVKLLEAAPVAPSFTLKAGASCSTQAKMQLGPQSFPVVSSCVLGYNVGEQTKQCKFKIEFPASFFIQPFQTTLDNLSTILTSSSPPLVSSSTSIPKNFGALSQFIPYLSNTLRVCPVHFSGDTAALAGKFRLGGSDVCVYVHWSRRVVEIHCANKVLGEGLASEIGK